MPSQPPRSLERQSLHSLTCATMGLRSISDPQTHIAMRDLAQGSCFGDLLQQMRGRSILLATKTQLPTVLAAIELDGIACRILLMTPDLAPHLSAIMAEGQVDMVVSDWVDPKIGVPVVMCWEEPLDTVALPRSTETETEWVLFTSGTTGQPKLVVHTLASLSGPLDDGLQVRRGAVWSTFYDVRRYGGLQILLRALLGGGSMVLSDADEAVSAFLVRLAAAGVTHISGTPSHWRRALMSAPTTIAPAYVRLSGEVADQAILNTLRHIYPTASIAHAFASTEAGVAFDVRDGLAGFPASYITEGPPNPDIELRVVDDTLQIRSSRTASGYLGHLTLGGDGGFIDTGDIVEQIGDRFFFRGRREGVINIGGQKVYPEEIEAVLVKHHPDVEIAHVWPRPNPIMGQIVAADVVLRPEADDWLTVRSELIRICRAILAPYKVPVMWRQVDAIDISPSGKVLRRHASHNG